MTADLEQFLSRHRRVSRNAMKWGGGIELEVSGYLSSEAPPTKLVSSIRAIVLSENRALVMENPTVRTLFLAVAWRRARRTKRR
jgi:hypothetical protein